MNNSSNLETVRLQEYRNKYSNECAQDLRTLKNSELDSRIKSLARQERELLTHVLHVIKEIDNRKLYLEMSYSSLFAYLTEAVGYSASSAQRRIDAARLLNEIPSLSDKIESGEIHLAQTSRIQKAAREIIRNRQIKVTSEDKLELLESLAGKNQRDTEKQVAQFFDMPIIQKSIEKTQADDSVRLEITLSKIQYDKLKQAQALVSHALPGNQIVDFIEYISNKVIKQKTTTAAASVGKVFRNQQKPNCKAELGASDQINSFGHFDLTHPMSSVSNINSTTQLNSSVQEKSESKLNSVTQVKSVNKLNSANQGNSVTNMNSENLENSADNIISARALKASQNGFSLKIKKKVLSHFSTCQYRDPNSDKICGSNWFLQVDHRHSRWAGGNNDFENATVLCSQHNKLKYRREVQLK